jgi:drug/metabolite transporter (DMT)-like permease
MAWLKSDTAKIIGAILAAVAGVLITQFPPPATIGTVAGVVFGILTALGLVSGGTKNNQPVNVVTQDPPKA